MVDDIYLVKTRTPFARQSIRLAVSSILRTPQNSKAEFNCFYTRVLDSDGRPLIGLDETDIANAAQAAIQTYEPLITIGTIDVEMTPVGAVAAIVVHYRTHDADGVDTVRIEFPSRSGVDHGG